MSWFANKVVVITGASSGIGAWMAQELSRQGAIVILIARSEERLHQTAALMQGKHEWMVTDVTSTEQVFEAVHQIILTYDKIDILINNAGFGVFENFIEADIDTMEQMMDVNYMGTVRFTKAVMPYMLEANSGHIVNIASLAGKIGTAKSSGYCASKHAVLGFTNSLRQELKGSGIFITAVNPGPIDTPFFDLADPTGNYSGKMKSYMLRPEQVGKAVFRAIIKRKMEVNLPVLFGWAAKFITVFPWFSNKFIYKFLNNK
ncbi:SDR family oxidoreductase [Paenibacillus psychroresistens]|uniref:SDR family oxidoreductase n=1 Tax=Paenibacillus psychroresistens TaxID=1778678 RepID=A0A6B8RH48_9BACL|nr:SDR family oxidoreductase [Paenibacillus psychroresistens]QGQ94872.1 SDR family oxidoreductase [Paenibacillus psychroresistens]